MMKLRTLVSPFIVLQLAYLFLLFAKSPVDGSGIEVQRILLYLLVTALSLVTHFVAIAERNWLRIDTVFLLSYIIVNFQWPLMLVVAEISPDESRFLEFFSKHLTYGSWLSAIGLVSWVCGYSISRRPSGGVERNYEKATGIGHLAMFSWALIVVFVLAAGADYVTAAGYKEVRAGGSVTVSGIAGYIYTVLTIIVMLVAAPFVYRSNLARRNVVANAQQIWPRRYFFLSSAFIAVFIILFIFAGERGPVIQAISGIAIAVASTTRPIGPVRFLFLAIAGAVFVTILGMARSSGWLGVAGFAGNMDPWAATQNLAKSAVTIYYGLEIVAQRGEFFDGQLWISNLLGVLPFAQSAFLALTDMTAYEINGANLITYSIHGPNASSGLGTSLVIDIFMNFGTYGVIVLMFVYGAICRTMQSYMSGSRGFSKFVIAGIFASLAFYTARGSLLTQLQPVLWGSVIAFVFFRIQPLTQGRITKNAKPNLS